MTKRVNIADRGAIGDFKTTKDGYLEGSALIVRTGIQQYHASELGLMGDEMVNVYRSEDEVFSKDSLETFGLIPITLGHPDGGVNVETFKDRAEGVTGQEVLREGDYLRIGLRITGKDAIAAVNDNVRELSAGYTANIIMEDGVAPDGTPFQARQIGIEANHLAIVKRGRAGSKARIGDDAQNQWGISPVDRAAKEKPMADKLHSVVVKDRAFQVNDEGKTAIDILNTSLSDTQNKLATSATELATAKSDIETKDAEIATLKQQVEDAKVTPAQLADMAKSHQLTMDKAKALGVDEKAMADKDETAIKRAAVDAKLGDAAKDWNDEQIAASFATFDAKIASKPFGSELKDGIKEGESKGFSDDVYAAAGVRRKQEGK